MRSVVVPILLFAFLLCQIDAQSQECKLNCGNGICDFTNSNQTYCKCNPGFAGKQCELIACDSSFQQCKNNGKCYMNAKKDEFQCICDENHQFTGALCEKSICADYCMNDNRCEVSKDYQNIYVPSCNCTDSRYTGKQCEFDRCESQKKTCAKNCYLTTSSCNCICGTDCDAQYCNGKGKCVEKGDKLGCDCKSGYSGDTCFVDDCKGYCFFNGTCVRPEDPKKSVYCECVNGSTEKRCGTSINSKSEAESSNEKSPKSTFQVIRVIIYGITITLLLCLFTICAYVIVQRGYADRLFQKRPSSSDQSRNPRATTSSTERVTRLLPSFRFFKSSQNFNRLDDEQPITHYENANV